MRAAEAYLLAGYAAQQQWRRPVQIERAGPGTPRTPPTVAGSRTSADSDPPSEAGRGRSRSRSGERAAPRPPTGAPPHVATARPKTPPRRVRLVPRQDAPIRPTRPPSLAPPGSPVQRTHPLRATPKWMGKLPPPRLRQQGRVDLRRGPGPKAKGAPPPTGPLVDHWPLGNPWLPEGKGAKSKGAPKGKGKYVHTWSPFYKGSGARGSEEPDQRQERPPAGGRPAAASSTGDSGPPKAQDSRNKRRAKLHDMVRKARQRMHIAAKRAHAVAAGRPDPVPGASWTVPPLPNRVGPAVAGGSGPSLDRGPAGPSNPPASAYPGHVLVGNDWWPRRPPGLPGFMPPSPPPEFVRSSTVQLEEVVEDDQPDDPQQDADQEEAEAEDWGEWKPDWGP